MSNRIKFSDTYDNIANQIKPLLQENPPNLSVYSIGAYPPWWETTITIYNRYENPTTQLITWYKHYLNNCYFKNVYEMLEIGNLVANNNSTLIRIPQNMMFKNYDEWVKIPNTNMNNFFTLHQGDIIIKGEVTDIIDETKRGMFSNDIIEKYKALGTCTIIQSTQINVGNGMGTPHYRVVGD